MSMGRPKSTTAWPIEDDWRERMREKMKVRRITQSSLARQLGTSAANVNRILTPLAEGGWAASAFAIRAGELVGEPLPLPPDGKIDDETMMLMRRLLVVSPLAYADIVSEVKTKLEQLERVLKRSSRTRRS